MKGPSVQYRALNDSQGAELTVKGLVLTIKDLLLAVGRQLSIVESRELYKVLDLPTSGTRSSSPPKEAG